MASLLVGDYVVIDHSDGAGTNVMDLHNRTWSPDALNATAPGLLDKLGAFGSPACNCRKCEYFVKRFNFGPECADVHWSGDNPCSLAEGKMGFYYKDSEILPPLPVGCHRYILRRGDGNTFKDLDARKVPQFDAAAEVRAIVEGQFLSMRALAERIGMPCPPECVIATGGGTANNHLLSLIASIFGCNVYTAQRPDSAALGAALCAAHGWICKERGAFVPMASVLEHANKENAFQCNLQAKMGPIELRDEYGNLAALRVKIERQSSG